MEERRKIKQIEVLDEDGNLDYIKIPNYKIHENFMTTNEIKYYKFLIQALKEIKESYKINLRLFAQVALNRIIDVNNQRCEKLWKDIRDKSIDFLVYNEDLDKIHCCIELNDETHLQPDRKLRDKLVKKALNDGGIEIFFEERKNTNYNLDEIKNKILSCYK